MYQWVCTIHINTPINYALNLNILCVLNLKKAYGKVIFMDEQQRLIDL